MSDLISRQAAIDTLRNTLASFVPYLDKMTIGIPLACEIAIRKLPSAEKTGKWLEKNRVYSEESHIEDWQSCCCSECGRYDTRPYMYYFDEPNYCSYCGARMGCEEE